MNIVIPQNEKYLVEPSAPSCTTAYASSTPIGKSATSVSSTATAAARTRPIGMAGSA
jgi:hypothetical protein